jgi:hypothetical protein
VCGLTEVKIDNYVESNIALHYSIQADLKDRPARCISDDLKHRTIKRRARTDLSIVPIRKKNIPRFNIPAD